MKHLDEIPSSEFKEISSNIAETIIDMVAFMQKKGICPVCFCHLVAEAARDLAKALKKKDEKHVKAH